MSDGVSRVQAVYETAGMMCCITTVADVSSDAHSCTVVCS